LSTYEELREEFERKVKELQERCPHPETYWAEEWWAIGHSTGYAVRICKVCNKALERIPLEEARRKGYLPSAR